MKQILFLITLLVSLISLAQENEKYVDSIVLNFTEKLKKEKIDDFFYVKEYCFGGIQIINPEDSTQCIHNGTYYETYLFWKNRKKTMVKKFDNCGSYNHIIIKNSNLFDFVNQNIKKLENENVKPYQTKKDSIVGETIHSFIISRSHSCNKKFYFKKGRKKFNKHFRLYYLTNDLDEKNINYTENNKLKIVELNRLCKLITSKLENEKKFLRL